MRSTIKNYFSVTKKEWNGIVVLIIFIALILAAPYVYQAFCKDSTINTTDFTKALAILTKAQKSQNNDDEPGTLVTKKATAEILIGINAADSAALTRLRGIGPSFARRIINYRNRLGGFVHTEQLKEVFGIDSEKYVQLQSQVFVDASPIRKIPINRVNFEELSRFPYLSYKQMNAIIQFREQHGNYESIEDMKNIVILNNKILHKIEPYLSFK